MGNFDKTQVFSTAHSKGFINMYSGNLKLLCHP